MANKAEKKKKAVAKAKTKEAATGFQLRRVNEFFNEVKVEFGKIVWPPKKQVIASTGVVVVLVILISFYLGAVDLVLGKLVGMLLR